MVWIDIALFCKAFKSANIETIIQSHHIHTGAAKIHGEPQRHKKKKRTRKQRLLSFSETFFQFWQLYHVHVIFPVPSHLANHTVSFDTSKHSLNIVTAKKHQTTCSGNRYLFHHRASGWRTHLLLLLPQHSSPVCSNTCSDSVTTSSFPCLPRNTFSQGLDTLVISLMWLGGVGGNELRGFFFFLFFLIQSIGLLMQKQQERDKNWVARRPEWRFGSARFYQVNASGQPQCESVDVAFRSRAVEAWQQLQSRFYDPSNTQPIKCLFSNKAGRTCAI